MIVKKKIKEYSCNDWLNLSSIFVIFLSFFYIAYLTPMQCDDFWYYRIGLKLKDHIHHYLHWSGRIVADYFSCVLLQIPSHAVASAIIASFATGICYLIAKIPATFNSNSKIIWWKLLVIAALYWIANPQIEDSTFWVVGACNYIVTTFFVLSFLYFLINKKNSISWWMIILALVAGCSNENSCLAIIYTMVILWIISHYEKINSLTINIKLNKKFLFIYSLLFVIGALILILAPGNFERIQGEIYQKWCKSSLIEKFATFIDQSEWSLCHINIAGKFYLLMLFLTGISWGKNRKEIFQSLLFFSTAVVSYVVMVASPYFPARSLNPTLCFLLLSISFLLNPSLIRYKILKIILAAAIFWIFLLFFKFFVMLSACHQTIMIQDAIRIDHIKYMSEKKGKHTTVNIPQHYISNLARSYRISFPFEFIPYQMEATWNGVDELNHIPVKYDYAVLRTGKTIPVENKTNLKNAKIYFQPKSWFIPQSTILLESPDPINEKLSVVLHPRNRKKQKEEIKLDEQTIDLQGKHYTGFTIENDLDPGKVVLKTHDM